MKKSFLMLGVAVAALTSCTNDEVVEMNQGSSIQFESFVNKSTRAVTTTTGLTNFYVFGYHSGDTNPVFSNVEVSFDETDGWGYDSETKYWTANTYLFGAYATNKASEDLNETTTNVTFNEAGTLTISNYSVGKMLPAETHSTDDLVGTVKTQDNRGLKNETVDLDFKHLLSQVKFQFVNNSNSYYMTVSDITFKAMPTGTCAIQNSNGNPSISWTLKDDLTAQDSLLYTYAGKGSYNENTHILTDFIAPSDDNTTQDVKENEYNSDYYLVLPVAIANTTRANFTICFYERIGVAGSYTYNLIQTIPYKNISLHGTSGPTDAGNDNNKDNDNITAWTPGYIYNYKAFFPVNPSEIIFSATVSDWKNDEVNDNTTQSEGVIF